jgi:hypothetical protein
MRCKFLQDVFYTSVYIYYSFIYILPFSEKDDKVPKRHICTNKMETLSVTVIIVMTIIIINFNVSASWVILPIEFLLISLSHSVFPHLVYFVEQEVGSLRNAICFRSLRVVHSHCTLLFFPNIIWFSVRNVSLFSRNTFCLLQSFIIFCSQCPGVTKLGLSPLYNSGLSSCFIF